MDKDLSQHSKEVSQLWSDYWLKENRRIPITFACDEQVWLRASGNTFREFYTDPKIHLKTQLEGKLWFCKNVIGDMIPGIPDRWYIGLQLWMEENEFFGCDVIYQDDDYAWGKPLPLCKDDLLHYISDIDPEENIKKSHTFSMYQSLVELADDMTFEGKPVEIVRPGGGTHGIFTKAAEIRGIEQLCLDIHDDPGFAERYLNLITEKTIERIKAWHKLATGADPRLPSDGGFSFADDSLQLISSDTYERLVMPCHERLYSAMAKGNRGMHLCGLASQHYKTLRYKLNVTHIDGPGTFVDHGYYLRELGPDFSFSAQTDHSILEKGSEEDIRQMMKALFKEDAKIPGRFQVMGFLSRNTPLRNIRVCYEAGKEHGII